MKIHTKMHLRSSPMVECTASILNGSQDTIVLRAYERGSDRLIDLEMTEIEALRVLSGLSGVIGDVRTRLNKREQEVERLRERLTERFENDSK